MKSIEEISDLISGAVWEGARYFLKLLSKENIHSHYNEANITVCLSEIIAFLLHISDRELFLLYGSEKREDIMDNILKAISESLKKYDDFILKYKREGGAEGVEKSFDYLCDVAPSIGFRQFYNERQLEYTQYSKLLPDKGKSLKGTLIWEFSKKIATFFNDIPNPATLVWLSKIITDIVIAFKNTLDTLLG